MLLPHVWVCVCVCVWRWRGTGPYGGRDDSEGMAGRQTGRLTERSGKERKIDGLIQPRRQRVRDEATGRLARGPE